MADNSGQDIVSLGLNIDSFDQRKATVLKEYISIFDSLAKYDGKIFNPVMGDGLTTFNTSIAQTNKLIDEMNIKLASISAVGKSFTSSQSSGFDKYSQSVSSAANATTGLKVQSYAASTSIESLGKNLTGLITSLRYIAYILPGVGIAGIFNLAFQAISAAAEESGIFSTKVEKLIENNTELNKLFKEQIDRLKEINNLYKGIRDVQDNNLVQEKIDIESIKERGHSRREVLEKELDLNKKLSEEARLKLTGQVGKEDLRIIDQREKELDHVASKIQMVNNAIEQTIKTGYKVSYIDPDNKANIFGKGRLEDKKKELEGEFDLIKIDLDRVSKTYSDYYNKRKEFEDSQARLEKFNSDEARKLLVETSKDTISVEQNKNKEILSNIQSTHEQRIKAIKDEESEQKKINNLNRINVTGTFENPNLLYPPESEEYKIAVNKQLTDDLKAKQKSNADILKENINFYQSQLKARVEIQKNEVEVDAINNERIEQNENSSLEKRLVSYNKYIEDKTKLQNLEYQLSTSAGKSSETDTKGSLTQKELDKLKSDRDKEILVQRSDAENKVFSIVYSSLQKELKALIDAYQIEGAENKKQLVEDLEANNKKYINREEYLKKWLRNKEKIEEEDKRKVLQKDIDDDEFEIIQLLKNRQKLFEGLSKSKSKIASAILLPDGTSDKKFQFDKAVGEYKAYLKAIIDADKSLTEAEKKQMQDRLKQAEVGFSDDQKKRDKWVDAALAIEHKLYEGIKTVGDRIYENQVSNVEKRKALIDEQYDAEKDAIEKSSLNAKDKLALDIQLTEQKHEYDIAARNEERRIKIEEANFNKKLAIADAEIHIAGAIIKDGLTTPKSVADAVIGAIELGVIIATPIPSYKHGIKSTPKGQIARFGEDGAELIKKPGEKPFVALSETVSWLPKGTEVIPLRNEYPEFSENKKDESWSQTKFLANQIKKSNKEIKNIFKPTIIINMGFENRKKQILGN